MVHFANPVLGPRIVPFGQARLASDVLPNGRPGFRVTVRYQDLDAFFHRPHRAMDIGNFYCGDRVLAMAAGTLRYLVDPNGALGAEITHRNGYRTQVWHISRWRKPNGTHVRRKQWIADIGSTGLDVGGCHGHVVVLDKNGQPVDPWPLLEQNQ